MRVVHWLSVLIAHAAVLVALRAASPMEHQASLLAIAMQIASAFITSFLLSSLLAPRIAEFHRFQQAVSPTGEFRHARIFEGKVLHTRLWPFVNAFTYRVFFMWHEIGDGEVTGLSTEGTNRVATDRKTSGTPTTAEPVLDGSFLWSANRRISYSRWPLIRYFRVATWHAEDYLSKEKVLKLIRKERPECLEKEQPRTSLKPSSSPSSTDDGDQYRIFLLCNWRFFGYSFNPICHYFVYRQRNGQKVAASAEPAQTRSTSDHPGFASLDTELGDLVCLVSEVSNTPWLEKCWYIHPVQTELVKSAQKDGAHVVDEPLSTPSSPLKSTSISSQLRYVDVVRKKMHVSPFMQMPYDYDLAYSHPGDEWHVRWRLLRLEPDSVSNATSPDPLPPAASGVTRRSLWDRLRGRSTQPTDGTATAAVQPVQQDASSCPFSGAAALLHTANQFHSRPPVSQPIKSGLQQHFTVHMSLTALPITQRNLLYVLVAYPFYTIAVVLGIHWEAAKLFLRRGATFYDHPGAAISKGVEGLWTLKL